MTKIHHVEDRNIEHAKSRDTMAHKLISLGAPDSGYRSTRGFAAVKGSQPAVDIQPRHGGKAKGGTVNHSWGNTADQIAKENMAHVVTAPADASSANPLDLMTSSQAGKGLAAPQELTGQERPISDVPFPAVHGAVRNQDPVSVFGKVAKELPQGDTYGDAQPVRKP